MTQNKFWETKTLEQFSKDEWESICDGCAKCCLIKLEDADSGKIHQTNACCKYLELDSCRCSDYPARNTLVPTCVELTPQNVHSISWLPSTCAYRLVIEKKPLPDWHHLMSGDRESVHELDHSIRYWATPETDVDDIFEHIIDDSFAP